MKGMNRVILVGRLGVAPKLETSKSGKPYARLNVATDRSWLNTEDQWEEKTDWHSVFVWGPLAVRLVENLKKGAVVIVEGSLTYWQVAQDTQKVYKNAIAANSVQYVNRPVSGMDLDNSGPPINHNAVAHPA